MLNIIKGNILNSDNDIIVHQTNCLGIMGGGLALQIKNKYPNVYSQYKIFCLNNRSDLSNLLGNALLIKTDDNHIIANCFGQYGIGKSIETRYDCLEQSLYKVYDYALENNLSVAIPYKLGCGLAGGDWSVVFSIIKKIFDNSDVNCIIYEYQGR